MIRTFVFAMLLLLLLTSCGVRYVHYSLAVPPAIDIQSTHATILIINRFDPYQLEFRRAKKTNAVRSGSLAMLATVENELAGMKVNVISAYDSVTMARDIHLLPDSTILTSGQLSKLAEKYQADYVLSLESYTTGFHQDEVEKVKNQDGSTSKTAHYSVYARSTWAWYDIRENKFMELTGNASRYHSGRSVVSALLAFGPAITPNAADIQDISKVAARHVAGYYKRGSRPILREIYAADALKAPGEAIMAGDYERARALLEPLARSGNNDLAAKSLYNMAVLAEMQGNTSSAMDLAELSLKKKDNRKAKVMLGLRRSPEALISQAQ
ncbi:DUF6340 family protein [Hufsiella ginkgonis]|uniref:Tetratricopeptide repeat protein n=1 Tax=Hufsiella ginkgonis TaxID=2695274 RepID=A0A7K1XT66_9SPHI|nr:DUF6340 family protein [Hufsiella ginkgonis]MXV14191.1 hypothetical protein [Hufsiella ginkgonis]